MLRVDARLGQDSRGELYLLTKGDGWVRRLVGGRALPPEDRDTVLDYIERSFRSLTPGNAIVYGVGPEALEGL